MMTPSSYAPLVEVHLLLNSHFELFSLPDNLFLL